jgi:hypothetical protein
MPEGKGEDINSFVIQNQTEATAAKGMDLQPEAEVDVKIGEVPRYQLLHGGRGIKV